MAFGKPQFTNHNHSKSAVNNKAIANQMPKKIQNRIYKQCALDGFNERIKLELAGKQNPQPRIYSHHATRKMYFEYGFNSVTVRHVEYAKFKQQAQDTEPPILRKEH